MESFVQGRTQAGRWRCRQDWADVLIGPDGLRLAEWLAEGKVEVVKQGPHRSVSHVQLGDREFYVKHFRCHTIWDRARHWFRHSPARREWQRAEAVAGRGVATIQPIAWQEQKGRGPVGESFLVTEVIPGSCTLEEYDRQHLRLLAPAERRAVLRQLPGDFGQFAAEMHQAGICHDDFHPGNFLVLLDGDRPQVDSQTGRFRFHAIDVAKVRLSEPLTWRGVLRALAVFNAAWKQRLSRTDRYRFWKAYLAARPGLSVPSAGRAMRQLARRTERHCRRRLRRRDRRTLRTSHDYVALRTVQGRAHGVSDLAAETLQQLSASPEAFLWQNMHQPVKLDRGSMIVEADLPLNESTVHVAYKRYRPQKWWKVLVAPFRPARAIQGWQRGHALRLRAIPAARPVLAVDRRRPWHRCESYLAVQWIEGSENLHLYLWRQAKRGHKTRMRQANRCAESLGRLLGRMHAQRVLHGDLKGSNLLIVDRDEQIEGYLVDVDDVCLDSDSTLRLRAADLARLAVSLEAHPWVSRTVRVRFLRAYLQQFGRGAECWKTLWQAIARPSQRMADRKRRKRQAIL